MPAWLIAVLRVIGIRRAADVVPVATRVGEAIAEAIDPKEPATLGETCKRPPPGWYCTREPFHDGPCAAWPVGEGPTVNLKPPGGTLIIRAAPGGTLIKAAPPRPPRKPPTKGK